MLPTPKMAMSIRILHTHNLIFTCENAWLYLANAPYNRENSRTPVAKRLPCHYCRSMSSCLRWCSRVSLLR